MDDLYNYVNPRTNKKAPLLSDEVYKVIKKNAEKLDSTIIYNRDFNYDYFGSLFGVNSFDDIYIDSLVFDSKNFIENNQLSKFGMVVPKFIEAALENKPLIIHGDGTQTRSFTWVGDVVNYFYLLANLIMLKPSA